MSTKRKINLAVLMAATALLAALAGRAVLAGGKPKPPGLANPALVFCGGTRWGSGGLFISTADGSRRQQITSHGGNSTDNSAIWSPDGGRIAFLRYPDSSKVYCDLYVINADGTNLRLIRSFTQLDKYLPKHHAGMDWSPDGTMILYCDGNARIAALDLGTGAWAEFPNLLGGGEVYQLTPSVGRDEDPVTPGFQGQIAWNAVWSEQVWDEVQQKWIWIGHNDIAVVPAEITEDASGAIQITVGDPVILEYEPAAERSARSYPVWSPDGGSIAFLDDGGWLLKVVDVQVGPQPFGEPVALCNWGDYYDRFGIFGEPAWSPDGAYIAFGAYSGPVSGGGAYQDVFRIRADGTGLTAVTTVGDKEAAFDPDWNPNWVNDLP